MEKESIRAEVTGLITTYGTCEYSIKAKKWKGPEGRRFSFAAKYRPEDTFIVHTEGTLPEEVRSTIPSQLTAALGVPSPSDILYIELLGYISPITKSEYEGWIDDRRIIEVSLSRFEKRNHLNELRMKLCQEDPKMV